uniref:Uncharacterized protein n=1 Tax=Tanacetum cinerariifolium TaxID=118510 RepID=A0A699H0X6_TANCI|nr:hypothetical protein [Tanacetum cinerariifolium]
MQQFWFTIKKTKKTYFYDFGLADKKLSVDVELFRKIIDICPKVLNEDFVAPPSEEELFTFLIELGYKRPMDHLARMFVHHMHQLWRTLATIINMFLSGKTSSNDRLCQSRVAILFTKIIINHFLLLNHSVPKGPRFALHTIKNDGVINRLKFVRIGEDFQEYGRAIPNTMLTEDIKQTEAYQTFIKYSTGLIPLNKSIGANTMQAIKNNKKPSRSQPYTGSSSKGDGITPEVPNEPTFIFTTSSEGTGTKPRVPDEEDKVDKEIKWLTTDEEKEKQVNQDDDDNRSIDIEETDDDEKTDDEFVHGDEYVHDDVDKEMKDAKDNETGKDNE